MTLIIVLTGALLLYVFCNMLYEKNWNKNLTVSVDFDRKTAVMGDTANLTEVIVNNKILPLLMVRLKFIIDRSLVFKEMEDSVSVSDQCYKNDAFSLLFYQKITRTLPFVCSRRGFFCLTESDVVSTNLFFNAQYVKHFPMYTELTVFPKYADEGKLSIPFKKAMGELLTRRYLYEDPFEFRGIRDYTSNDTMSSINWKSSAKCNDLKVNVHDATNSQEVCILLNLEYEIGWQDDYLMEECISIAAGLADKFMSAGVKVSMYSNGCDLNSKSEILLNSGESISHMDTLLYNLARIDLKLPMRSFGEIIGELVETGSCDKLYIMISVACSYHLQSEYQLLAEKNNNAMWIIPYTYKPEYDIKNCPQVEVFPWEVTANAK